MHSFSTFKELIPAIYNELILIATITVASLYIPKWYTEYPRVEKKPPAHLSDTKVLGATSSSWLSVMRARLTWVSNGVDMISDSFTESPGIIFRAPTIDDFYLLPPRYAEELKMLPPTKLNATNALVDYFQGSLTSIDMHCFGRPLWSAVRGITSQMPKVTRLLVEKCSSKLDEEFNIGKGWTLIAPHQHILHVVASMDAHIFVGEPLANSKAWVDVMVNYSRNVFVAATLLKLFPKSLRSIIAKVLPQTRRVNNCRDEARKLLLPEIIRRREARLCQKESGTAGFVDTLTILEQCSAESETPLEYIADRQLGLAFAGIHGPTNHAMNVVYDLAARWNTYGSELREELEEALAQNQGIMDKQVLNQLSKLDSFMKESHRLQPGSTLSFFRKVKTHIQLSNGQNLHPSITIAVPTIPIDPKSEANCRCASSSPSSPSNDCFDGFRFHRMRQHIISSNDKDNRIALKNTLFTTPSSSYLCFGLGKFACPGRFYAECQVKVIVSQLLLRYDFRLPDGYKRPKNIFLNDVSLADPAAKILFRARQK